MLELQSSTLKLRVFVSSKLKLLLNVSLVFDLGLISSIEIIFSLRLYNLRISEILLDVCLETSDRFICLLSKS
jgi:hypothetical protein